MGELDGNVAKLASSCNPDCIVVRMQGKDKKFFDMMDRLVKIATGKNAHIIVFTPDTITDEQKKRLSNERIRLAVHRQGRFYEDIVNEMKGIGAS